MESSSQTSIPLCLSGEVVSTCKFLDNVAFTNCSPQRTLVRGGGDCWEGRVPGVTECQALEHCAFGAKFEGGNILEGGSLHPPQETGQFLDRHVTNLPEEGDSSSFPSSESDVLLRLRLQYLVLGLHENCGSRDQGPHRTVRRPHVSPNRGNWFKRARVSGSTARQFCKA